LVDRLVSIFYPVHRYRCRSFVCNWEGNLRHTPALGRWEALESYSDGRSATVYYADDSVAPSLATEPRVGETRPLESDTLPSPSTRLPKQKKPDGRAESRDGTNAPRRTKKRGRRILADLPSRGLR
jgi:hypothetical protein